jgi:hypothetical protein
MWEGHMITYSRTNLAVGMVILIAFSSILVNHAAGIQGGVKLPPDLVTIEVSNGTESYFVTELRNVPSDYDVTNGTYLGWCVDIKTEMARSPATHEVTLYSSISPPGELVNERWDLVNYILNNKRGVTEDIQQAIWYFVHLNDHYDPTRPLAWVIINDAQANGNGFAPEIGQTLAIICYPIIMVPSQPAVQISIIEIARTHSSDIAVVNVSASKTVVGEGQEVRLYVTVENQGTETENFNVSVFANSTAIGTLENITLENGSSIMVTIPWNTSGYARAYTISAHIAPLEGETDLSDNTLIYGIIQVSCVGDINGDYITDAKDLILVKNAIPSMPSTSRWDPNADMNDDGIISLKDYQIVKKHIPSQLP